MKIAFYISGKATRLCEIISDNRFKTKDNYVKFVISDNLTDGKDIQTLCVKNGIDWLYYDYQSLSDDLPRRERNNMLSDFILDNLKKYSIDYLFVFGHHLLVGNILNVYKNHIICFHPSLLPHFVGFGAIDQAVDNNDHVIGNSAFLIDEGMDSGKVILQSVMHISNFEDENYNRLLHPIVDMFYYIVRVLEDKRMIVTENEVIIKSANYNMVHFFPEIDDSKLKGIQ